MRDLYLSRRFYLVIVILCILFALGMAAEPFYYTGMLSTAFFLVFLLIDSMVMFRPSQPIHAQRIVSDRLSNGDQNPVEIRCENRYPFPVQLEIIDELPFQFQRRDLSWKMSLDSGQARKLQYALRPVKRGEYHFGALNLFAHGRIGLVIRRFMFDAEKTVKVYPSYIQMRKYGFAAIHQKLQHVGLKKQRRLGHTMEFEQIKEYVAGDDRRSMNWKATGRRNQLMVNQYRDERAQQVINVIDKGRLMKMPFDGLSLLDYAINASLVLSYIALHRQDRAGLVTFTHRMSSYVPPERRRNQMQLILEALYHQKTRYTDANFERLSIFLARQVRQRSLLLLYTNFESLSGLERQLASIKALARKHVVIVLFFQNSGLSEILGTKPGSLRKIYHQTIAEKLIHEKQVMVRKLQQVGAHAVLTSPKDLSVNTINKYLELKGRGVI